MKDNHRLGVVLAAIGSIVGLLAFYLFIIIYNPMIQVELDAGRPDEAFVVRFVFPLLGYLAITAGSLWIVALYGFLIRQRWAWSLGLVASTLSLLAGFFPMIPAMSRSATPYTAAIFFPSLLLWIGLLFVRPIRPRIGLLAFIAGLAYILAFMDGVATIDKIQLSVDQPRLNGMYVMVQQINWWASAAWAVFVFALLNRKTWAQPLGIFAGLMAAIGGFPLGVVNMLEVGRFSMFIPSPILSTALVVTLILPATRRLLLEWAEAKPGVTVSQPEASALPVAASD